MENVHQKHRTCFQLERVFCYFSSAVLFGILKVGKETRAFVIWKTRKARELAYLQSEGVTCISYLKTERHVHHF